MAYEPIIMIITPIFETRELEIINKIKGVQTETNVNQIALGNITGTNFDGLIIGIEVVDGNKRPLDSHIFTGGGGNYIPSSSVTSNNTIYFQVYAINSGNPPTIVWRSKIYQLFFSDYIESGTQASDYPIYPQFYAILSEMEDYLVFETYSDVKDYTLHNKVYYNGSTYQYIANEPSSGHQPPDRASDDHWKLVALAGLDPTITIGTVNTVNSATSASVINSGTNQAAIFDFNIPRGSTVSLNGTPVVVKNPNVNPSITATYPNGDSVYQFNLPRAPKVIANSTTTILPGNNASVTYNTNAAGDTLLNFSIPQGLAATIGVNSTTTLNPVNSATVVNIGNSGAALLNFGIPRGNLTSINASTPVIVVNPNVNPTLLNNSTPAGDNVIQFALPRAPKIIANSTTTGLPGTSAAVTINTNAAGDSLANFTVPRGATVALNSTSVIPVSPNTAPSLTDTGTNGDKVLTFKLPLASSFSIGTVTNTAYPNGSPQVTATANGGNYALNFQIPRSATVSIGATSTLTPGTNATVTPTYNNGDVTLAFGIPQGIKGDTGANLTAKGSYANYASLIAAHPTGSIGDAYAVGPSGGQSLYIWDPNSSAWVNFGSLGSPAANTVSITDTGNYYATHDVEAALQQVYTDKVNVTDISNADVANTIVKRVGNDIKTTGIYYTDGTNSHKMYWDSIYGTGALELNNGSILQMGQETHAYGIADGVSITSGQVLMFSGSDFDTLKFKPANAATPGFKPHHIIGIATTNATAGDSVYVTLLGRVHGVNVSTYALGDLLYYDTTSQNGGLTNTKPTDPAPAIKVGVVVKNTTDGTVFSQVDFGSTFDELHDVYISSPSSRHLPIYNASSSRWENGLLTSADVGLSAVTNESKITMFTNPTFTGNVALPTGTTKVGQTTLTQGGAVSITLPSTAGTLYVSGGTDVAIADGGTGASDAATARTNLGLAIGTNVQAYNATLTAVASGLYSGDDNITTVGTIGTGAWAATDIAITHGGTGASDAATAATNLGLGTASNVQHGSLGVGTAASGVSGEIRATNNVTAYYSDARLKDFKGKITEAVDKIKQINGYYYTANEEAAKFGYDTKKLQVGVSAQELEKVLPEVVTEAPIGHGYLTVWYEKITPLLIEAIKEQQIQLDNQAQKIQELEQKIFGEQ